MGKAYIFNKHLDNDDRAALELAVRAAGYDPVYGVPANISSVDPEADIGVVGLPVGSEDVATVNARTQAFAGAGVRVVGIWIKGKVEGGTGIPEGIGKYGTTVDIGSLELISALTGQVDVWEEAGGAPSPTPETKRNKC